jgi:hypothetical protein
MDIEKLIDDHYQSCIKRNLDYKYSKEEHKKLMEHLVRNDNKYRQYAIDFISGSTHANNNEYNYHPV